MRKLVWIPLIFSLVACGPAEETSESQALSGNAGGSRIYLKDASNSQMKPYIIEEKGEDLLVFCHVPLDNPIKSRTHLMDVENVDGYRDQDELEDYLGACGRPDVDEDSIVLDDPVFEEDGVVCEGLTGDELYDCLQEHDQHITVEL